jgi:hypothetical protein
LAALDEIAIDQLRRGQLSQAKGTCEEAVTLAIRCGLQLSPAAGLAHIGIGEVLCEWNELEDAAQALTYGLHLLQGTTERNVTVRGYTALARTQRAQGDIEGALLTLQRGDERLAQIQISAINARAALAAQQVRLAIVQGNLVAALQSFHPLPAEAGSPLAYIQQLMLVYLRLAQHQRDPDPRFLIEATQILTELLHGAEAA